MRGHVSLEIEGFDRLYFNRWVPDTTKKDGPVRVFFETWMSRIPLALTAADREHGCWWQLAMRQAEVSVRAAWRTITRQIDGTVAAARLGHGLNPAPVPGALSLTRVNRQSPRASER